MQVKAGQVKVSAIGDLHIRFDNGRYCIVTFYDGAAKIIEEMQDTDIHNAPMCADLFVEKLLTIAKE